MILRPKLDPSYFLFRNVTTISSRMKLFLRVVIFCSSILHACIVIFGLGIISVILILLILRTLDRQISINHKRSNFRNICEYVVSIKIYRQLQIIDQVTNHLVRYILPVVSLMLTLCAVMMGFMVIKMTGGIPFTLVFLEITSTASTLGFIQIGFSLMADVMKKSTDFIRTLQLHVGYVSYRKRQLRSCRHLKIMAGSYFCIKKSTPITLFGLIAYYTMSLVISV